MGCRSKKKLWYYYVANHWKKQHETFKPKGLESSTESLHYLSTAYKLRTWLSEMAVLLSSCLDFDPDDMVRLPCRCGCICMLSGA
jgi:hypothetical protein